MTPIGLNAAISKIAESGSQSSVKSTDDDGGFAKLLNDVVRSTNDEQLQADQVLKDFASGETDNVQDVVMAMAKADMSFKFLLEVRNHLIESYQEISRMQV